MSDWANSLIDRATKSLPSVDLDVLANLPQDKFREFLNSLSAEDRDKVYGWARSANEIREATDLSRKEKETRVLSLDTTSTIFGLLRALLDVVAARAPEKQRVMVRTGIGVAAVAAAGLNFEVTGLAVIVLRAALPAFVLSDAGGRFCAFILADAPAPGAESKT